MLAVDKQIVLISSQYFVVVRKALTDSKFSKGAQKSEVLNKNVSGESVDGVGNKTEVVVARRSFTVRASLGILAGYCQASIGT